MSNKNELNQVSLELKHLEQVQKITIKKMLKGIFWEQDRNFVAVKNGKTFVIFDLRSNSEGVVNKVFGFLINS